MADACTLEAGYCLDPSVRALVFRGRKVDLAPRSFSVLGYLAAHKDRVVSKDELLETIWPPGSAEGSLRQEVYALRRELKKYGLAECVVTASQLGYRFEPPRVAAAPLAAADRRAVAAAAYFADKRDDEHLSRALSWYERASSSTPALLEAHTGALRAATTLALRSAIPLRVALERADVHLRAIERIDPEDLEGRAYRAFVAGLRGDAAGAAASLDALDRAFPGEATILHLRSWCRLMAGAPEAAVADASAAADADPSSLDLFADLGLMLTHNGAYEAARAELLFLHALDPADANTATRLAGVHVLAGGYDRALALLRPMAPSVARSAMLCVALARSGAAAEATDVLDSLLAERTRGFVSGYSLAQCYAALGDADAAVRMLQLARGEPLSHCLASDPWLADLRTSPRFTSLTSRKPVP